MKKILAYAFLAALLTSGAAIAAGNAADPVVGTWTLDAAKSTFTAGPAVKDQTRTYSKSDKGTTAAIKTVGADGKESTTETTYRFDGKDYPVTGNPMYDGISGRQVNSHTATFTLKRGGKAVGTTRRRVSQDGKTLTASIKLTDANGEKTDNVMVFNKQ
jgi:hypothetical protein